MEKASRLLGKLKLSPGVADPETRARAAWSIARQWMVIAAAVYHLAMREEPLPRMAKDQMPVLPTR